MSIIWLSDFDKWGFCPHSLWLDTKVRNRDYIPGVDKQLWDKYLEARKNPPPSVRKGLELETSRRQRFNKKTKKEAKKLSPGLLLAALGIVMMLTNNMWMVILGLLLLPPAAIKIIMDNTPPAIQNPELKWKMIYKGTPDQKAIRNLDLGLSGKPDTVWEAPDGRIVVDEIKYASPVLINNGPSKGHKMQLVAGMYLLESLDKRIAYGKLRYPSKTFTIEYNDNTKNELLSTIAQIRSYNGEGSPVPINKCKTCVFYGNLCRLEQR